MKLTERDLETLGCLIAAYDSRTRLEGPEWADKGRDGVAPIDCGGWDSSHHSKTLTKLAAMGLAEHRKRGAPWGDNRSTGYRGSKVYRPTDAGRAAFKEAKQ